METGEQVETSTIAHVLYVGECLRACVCLCVHAFAFAHILQSKREKTATKENEFSL